MIFRSPECVDLLGRVTEIFGRQLAGQLTTIEAAENGMKLTGLIGLPGQGRSTRHEMITFINQRPVDSRALNYALIESYHESLPKGRYPLAFVFFEIDPAAVDVNVHPAKREVRFRSETMVRGFIIRSVLQRLRELGEVGAPVVVAAPVVEPDAPRVPPVFALPKLTNVPPSTMERRIRDNDPASSGSFVVRAPASPPVAGEATEARPAPAVHQATPGWRFLGCAHASYALFETKAGLVLLDRRAAHERIWFERLQEQFQAGTVPMQRLLLPVPLELDPIASALLLDRLEFLNGHGFEVVEFGRNFFRIEGVPAWMEPSDAESFVREILGALRDGRLQESRIDVAREQLARLAAARAVRLGEAGGEAAMLALVAQLFACRSPLTSPGGTPTHVELSHGELARRFQR
jgi:DNA mismatch repair protein MutL